MSSLALSMLKNTFDGFIKHDSQILAVALKEEEQLNNMERNLADSLASISKDKGYDKKNIMLLANIVEDLEEIGDYIKDMVERIEIKIEEKLLFSDDAVNEYKHLYNTVETELEDVDKALKMKDKNFAKRILCNDKHVDKLVKKYRDTHAKRFVSGVCEPRACNMFLNLLDFTAQISHHAKTIAKYIIDLKW
ncbi:MAG: PhoU domain-containing protein [Candidatus Omnitrophota bacterium]